jgi:hypothetical protein
MAAASASDTRSATANTRPDAWRVGTPISPVGALPRGNSLSAVAAGITTRRTTAHVLRGKRLSKEAPERVFKSAATGHAVVPKLSGPGPLPNRWTWARAGITSSEGGVLSRPAHSNHKS